MSCRRPLRDQRGTAVTETLMLTWIIIMFIASALQLFRVNQGLYSAITSAHMQMFNGAFKANCYNRSAKCVYNSDLHAQVRWHPTNMPEVYVTTIGMFRSRLGTSLMIKAWPGAMTPRTDGYKRTRMGAGTYYPICDCSYSPFGTCMAGKKSVSSIGFC